MNKGGRPRNAWTPSRKRRLARLHALTTLDKDEISSVLRAHDFNPSSSDVQKKLRQLLPRDYAKDYKSFRPLKDHSMSARLDKLRKRTSRQRRNTPRGIRIGSKDLQQFEGPASAFRDYSGPNDLQFVRQSPRAPEKERESQIVVPSLLLLDGSSVMPVIRESQHFSNSTRSSAANSISLASRASSILSLRAIEDRLKHSSSFIKHVHSVLRFSSTNSWRSSLSLRSSGVSVQSLLRMQSIVNSIVRSRPASETQITDALVPESQEHGPSLDTQSSSVVCGLQSDAVENVEVSEEQRHISASSHLHKLRGPLLSEKEESVWHDLIDESGLTGPFSPKPEFPGMSLERRYCCNNWKRRDSCGGCGMQLCHSLARLGLCDIAPSGSSSNNMLLESLNQQDYFGNTPLHFAAVSPNWPQLAYFINRMNTGASIASVNTSGATFLHVLFEYLGSLKTFHEVGKLIRKLAGRNFPFSLRDCHGRTAAHMLFDNRHRLLEKLSQGDQDVLLDILNTMGLKNKSLMDNLGRTLGGLIVQRDSDGNPLPHQNPTIPGTTFIGAMSELSADKTKWLLSTAETDKYSWVDSDGDTALIALMKGWTIDMDETQLPDIIKSLVRSGAAVNMRDRAGDTALAIASRRGLRPAVTALHSLGACVNCQNYLGVSILRGARRELRHRRKSTRDEDGKLYAMILSCTAVLIDRGAVMHPTGYQEWADPSSPIAQGPGIAC